MKPTFQGHGGEESKDPGPPHGATSSHVFEDLPQHLAIGPQSPSILQVV